MIITMGGRGSTESMMNTWKEFYVDKSLTQAYLDDKILCGLNMDSIC